MLTKAVRGDNTLRDKVIRKAYLEHGYNMATIARHAELHYSTVSKVIKGGEDLHSKSFLELQKDLMGCLIVGALARPMIQLFDDLSLSRQRGGCSEGAKTGSTL